MTGIGISGHVIEMDNVSIFVLNDFLFANCNNIIK